MRIAPDRPRLRLVALSCWAIGGWWLLQTCLLAPVCATPLLAAASIILGAMLLATGTAFWLLANDRRAGVSFDRKGLSLNLGHSSAFVSWDNIAALGVTRRRVSLLALGSRSQLGIRLHNPEQYLQSYETRVPAAPGPFAAATRLVARISRGQGGVREPGLATVAALRRRTGYDILVPEAQLGGRATAFVTLLESYRLHPASRGSLPTNLTLDRG